MRKALIETTTGKVLNVIEWQPDSSWPVPVGCQLIDAANNGSPGDTWDGTKFIPVPPVITEPPRSSHVSVLTAVDAAKTRPARVKRVWQGSDYFYDCFATQTVKDEFVAGKIAIGDYVIVHFDQVGEQIVTAKVWKSW